MDAGLLDIHSDQTMVTEDWPSALGAGEQAAMCLLQLVRRAAAPVGLRVIGIAGILIKAKQQVRIEVVAS